MTYDIFKGKRCFISGATGGLGRQIALKMAEYQCEIFLTSQTEEKLKSLKNEIRSTHGNGIRVEYKDGDLNKPTDVDTIISYVRKAMGDVDVLINCAGVFIVKSLVESLPSEFDLTFNVNVKAPYSFCRSFSQDMMRNGWGRIVNIGSSSAYGGAQNTTLYCASKHALLGLTKALQEELKEQKIRTYFVAPAGVKTEMGARIPNQDYATFLNPKEIAEYIAFICSYDNELISDEIRLNRLIIQ